MSRIIDLLTDRARGTLVERGIETIEAIDLLCVLANIYLASFLIRALLFQAMAKWPTRQKKKHGIDDIDFDIDALADAVRTYRDALEQVQEFHKRIKGRSEPFEGIRILRERNKDKAEIAP